MGQILVIAAIGYVIGVLVYTSVKIWQIRKEYPLEAREMKIIRTYWIREWAAFLISIVFGLAFVFFMPDVLHKEIYHVEIANMVRVFSVAVGLSGQWIAISAFGVTQKFLKQQAKEKFNIDLDNQAAQSDTNTK